MLFFQCRRRLYDITKSKKISIEQDLIQLDPITYPHNQNKFNQIHKLTAVYEMHAR